MEFFLFPLDLWSSGVCKNSLVRNWQRFSGAPGNFFIKRKFKLQILLNQLRLPIRKINQKNILLLVKIPRTNIGKFLHVKNFRCPRKILQKYPYLEIWHVNNLEVRNFTCDCLFHAGKNTSQWGIFSDPRIIGYISTGKIWQISPDKSRRVGRARG